MPFVNPNTPPPATAPQAEDDNTITGLRAELFATLRGLRTGKIDIDQARAVSDVAQTIINSAKVEVEHAKAVGATAASAFLAPPAGHGTRRITR